MEAIAKLHNCRIAPRKMQLVVDTVRGRNIDEALNILKFEHKKGALYIKKLLLSAISNWENKYPDYLIQDAGLHIKSIYVTQAKMLKRVKPAPRGRAHRIRKRSNHVTVVLQSLSIEKTEEKETTEAAKVQETDK